MQENLVIVESPAKAKTIEKFLGKDYVVKSSFGHIRDLSKKGLGIDIDAHFAPDYEILPDKRKVVDELSKLSKSVDTVWLASDEDREGEAIAWHLAEVLDLPVDKTKRIVFHEITKPAILHAIETPRTIDMNLVNAQQARRVLDRIVGFELSPVLWKKVKPSLSAGRVQSVAVRLIVEREREIIAFQSTPYYRVVAQFYRTDDQTKTLFKAELSSRFETAAEAEAETEQQLNCYADVCKNALAMPVVKGRKTDKEKFAGAEATYTIESMMKDRKALQSGTSHYFGDKFSRAYDVTFTGRDNKLQYPFQTSWGTTTRLIGAVIMTHGDNNGLVLPPAIAPIQVVVIPVAAHKPGVLEAAAEIKTRLEAAGLRVKLDDSDNSPGWKFAEYEMKGVPVRVEIGPRDLEKGQCCLARRDTGEKSFVTLDELESQVQSLLTAVHDNLYAQAEKNLEDNTFDLNSWQEVKEMVETKGGFARTKWCGKLECELKMKELAGVSSRCMPLKQSGTEGVCPVCGEKCTTDIYWGVAY